MERRASHRTTCGGFVAKRLAPALPANDGRQTPMRGHPCLSLARHRDLLSGCLAKWHDIPQGVSLSEEQQRYIVAVIITGGCTDESAMRLRKTMNRIARVLYLPPLFTSMLSFMRIYLSG
ncbi:DUF4186 family protein [Shigella flexneri]